jgi:fibronectin-binding autotransporter adhesin
MLLLLPETKATGSVSLSANSSVNVDLTIGISGESHPGSFSVLSGTTETIDPSQGQATVLVFQFDYALANLAPNTFATGQVTIHWSEQRAGGASGQLVLPLSVLALSSGGGGTVLAWDTAAGNGTNISEGIGGWQTGAGNWNNNGSDQSWMNGNKAVFGGGSSGNAGTVTLNGNVVPTQLTFSPPAAGNYTIDLASYDLTTANSTDAVEVIGGTSATIKATGGGRLLTPYSGAARNFTLAGSLVIDAPVSGPGVVFAAGAGNLNLTNPANDFTGIFGKRDGGDLAFSSIAASGLASAAGAGGEVRIGYDARAVYTGTGNWTNRTFNLFGDSNGTLDNDGTGTLVWVGPFSNTTTAGGARKLTLGGSNTGDNDFQGGLSDHPSNGSTLDLEKNDSGTWILSGNNTHTGVTTVSAGILQIKNNDALGTTAGNTIVNNTGILELGGGVITAEPITIATGQMGALSATWGSSNFLTGAVTLTSNADFRLGPGITTFSGGITSANNSNLSLNGRAVVNTTPINIGTGQLGFTSNSPATATEINVTGNTWGIMLFNFGGYLKLGAANILPSTTDVEFGWSAQSWSSGTLDLNGFDQTVASIGIHSLSVGLGGDQDITGGGTLIVNLTSGTKTYEGRITDGATPTSLVKKGAGMQILNNLSGTPNSWSGNTTVYGGTLRLSTATLADASTVSISSGAVLNLEFSGTDTVTALFIGTNQMAAGVYGSSGINVPEITGTGTLTVTSGPVESFSSWITRTFANGAVSVGTQGPTDDPDNDGLDNLVEYGLGKDPTVSSQPAGVLSGNLLTYTKGADAIANGDVSWVIETSETLAPGSWTPQVTQPGGNPALSISYLFTPGSPAKNFVRLKVTQN